MKKLAEFLVIVAAFTGCLALAGAGASAQPPVKDIGAPLNTFERPETKEPPPIKAFPLPRSMFSSEVQDGYRFWVKLGTMLGGYGLAGGTVAAGYQHEVFGVDLRMLYASCTYGSISTAPNESDVSSYPDGNPDGPDAEQNRFRDPSDKWSMFLVEPGISATARLFPNLLPLMSEKSRIGVGFGHFTDQTNSLGFSPLIFSIGGSLQYQLGYRSPWGVEFGAQWNFGRVVSSVSTTDQQGRLPLSYVTYLLNLVYWY